MLTVEGIRYKIGVRNYVFMFDGLDWIRSTKTLEEYRTEEKRQAHLDSIRAVSVEYRSVAWFTENYKMGRRTTPIRVRK